MQAPHQKPTTPTAPDGSETTSLPTQQQAQSRIKRSFGAGQAALKYLILALLTAAIAAGVWQELSLRERERHTQRAAALTQAVEMLSREQYRAVKDELFSLMAAKDARAALDALHERVETDGPTARSCHLLAHELGQKAYGTYGDFAKALSFNRSMCNSGYLHGIIEARLKGSVDVFADMKTLCNAYAEGSFAGWECYHGVGHGLMFYTDNDLPRSIAACDAYETDFKRSNCANGVFMENFNSDQKLHRSAWLKDNSFYPCGEQEERHKGSCYFYAPEHYLFIHKNDYQSALAWCRGAETPVYESVCVQNVAGNAIVQHIKNPKGVESLCMSAPEHQKTPCLAGMVSLYINHFGALAPARELCGQLEPENRSLCAAVVKQNEPLFE